MVFKYDRQTCGEPAEVACGRCVSCRLRKSAEWGSRIAHEVQILEEKYGLYSSFITLTYDEKNLPFAGSLVPEDMQKFVKKLREHLWRKFRRKIRYYYSGEYGSRCPKHEIADCPQCGSIQRPHYHAIILGFDFGYDKEYVGDREGLLVYRSEFLDKLWKKGFHEIGSATFESAAYCARYVMKKQLGPDYEGHYTRYDPWTDAWYEVEPEFARMSRNPGIGKEWFDDYVDDVFPSDEMSIPGRGVGGKPAKYYDYLYELSCPDQFEEVKEKRREAMTEVLEKRASGDAPSLQSMAMVQDAKISMLSRRM